MRPDDSVVVDDGVVVEDGPRDLVAAAEDGQVAERLVGRQEVAPDADPMVHLDDRAHPLDLVGLVQDPRVSEPVEQHVEPELLAHPVVLGLAGAGDMGQLLGQLHRTDAGDIAAGGAAARVAAIDDHDVADAARRELARERESCHPGTDDHDVGGRREIRGQESAEAAAAHRGGTRSPRRTGLSGGRAVGIVDVSAMHAKAWRHCFPWHGPVRAPVRRLTSSGSKYPAPCSVVTSWTRTSSQKQTIAPGWALSCAARSGSRRASSRPVAEPTTDSPATVARPSGSSTGTSVSPSRSMAAPAARTRSRFGLRSPKTTRSTETRDRVPSTSIAAAVTRCRPPTSVSAWVGMGPVTEAPARASRSPAATSSSPLPTRSAFCPGTTPVPP